MKRLLTLILFLFFIGSIKAATFEKILPGIVETVKKSVVPVVCYYDTNSSWGTAVIVGNPKISLAITCAHIFLGNDSANVIEKVNEKIKNIYLRLNFEDGSSYKVKADLLYADFKNDFAVLIPYKLPADVKASVIYIQSSLWKTNEEFKEGDKVLYIGYPLNLGIQKTNHPLSRTGIISMLSPERDYFFIDGFVQHGHSGSPVFVIKEKGSKYPTQWDFGLIGITIGFPKEFSDLYEETLLIKTGEKITSNPGFTTVVPMDLIIPQLNKIFEIGTQDD